MADERERCRTILAESGRHLAFHAILASLCSRIPIPLVDGIARRVVRSWMFQGLSKSRGQSLSVGQLYTISGDSEDPNAPGCIRGCLTFLFVKVALFPVRRVVKLVDTVVNYQKVVDEASHIFVEGYLAAYLIEAGLWPEGGATQVRTLIDAVTLEAGTRPVQTVFAQVLEGARQEVTRSFSLLVQGLKRLGPRRSDEQRVTRALGEMEPEQESILGGVSERLVTALSGPEDYFVSLADRVRSHLETSAPAEGGVGAD